MQDRSWLVRFIERNHFQAALWRQKSHASCFIYILDKTKYLLYAKWSLSTKIIIFPRRQFGKNVIVNRSFQASWSEDRLKWLHKIGNYLHSDLYVAKLSKVGRLAYRQMQKNVFYLINLVIVYIGIFRSWSWRHARALHVMIR